MSEHLQALIDVTDRTDESVWGSYVASVTGNHTAQCTRLRFPTYREGSKQKIRFSEQEARFAFARELDRTAFLYSVETPTSELHQITGKRGMSAQTDVTVYCPEMSTIANVEFKAKGIKANRKNKVPIQKDIEKLLREPVTGVWFHCLKGVKNSTLGNFWNAFVADLQTVILKPGVVIQSPAMLVHICVVRQRFSIRTLIDTNRLDSLSELHVPEHRVSRSELLGITSTPEWTIHQPTESSLAGGVTNGNV